MNSKVNWKYFIDGANSILNWNMSEQQVFKPTSEFVEEFFKRSLNYVESKSNNEVTDTCKYEDETRIKSLKNIVYAVNKMIAPFEISRENILQPNKNTIQAIQSVINFLFSFEEETYDDLIENVRKQANSVNELKEACANENKEKLKTGMELGKRQLEIESMKAKLRELEVVDLKTEMARDTYSTQKLMKDLNEIRDEYELEVEKLNEIYNHIQNCSKKKGMELLVKDYQIEIDQNNKDILELTKTNDTLQHHIKIKLDEYCNVLIKTCQKIEEKLLIFNNFASSLSEFKILKEKNAVRENSIKLLCDNKKMLEEKLAVEIKNLREIESNVEHIQKAFEIYCKELIDEKNNLNIQHSEILSKKEKHRKFLEEHSYLVPKCDSVYEEIRNILIERNEEIEGILTSTMEELNNLERLSN